MRRGGGGSGGGLRRRLGGARKLGVVRKDSVDGAPVMVLDPEKEGAERYLDLAKRYIAMGMPCGFLEGGECGIYEDRPLVCREYLVSSPAEFCKTLEFEGIKPVGLPVKMSEGLGEVGAFLEGRGVEEVPLFAALAWAERERGGREGRGEGVWGGDVEGACALGGCEV